jgi:hypothetical protein
MSTFPDRPDSDRSVPTEPIGQPLSAMTYLAVSGVGLVLSVGLLLFLVLGAERILAAGLDHRVFYVLLVPLGLSAAAFAFGAMNSTGTFTKQGSRQVGLSGPAMFAALVVVGGFFLVPEGGTRTLAVRVDRSVEAGGGPVPGALVTVDWGAQRLTQSTDGSGQASFLGLPPGASGVDVAVEAPGYASERRTFESVPANGVLRLEVDPQTQSTRVTGTVFDRQTGAPLQGIALNFGSGAAADTTDASGNFEVTLPLSAGSRVSVIGTRDGTRGLNTEVILSGDTPIRLEFGGG